MEHISLAQKILNHSVFNQNEDFISAIESFTLLKVQLFLSCHITHLKHKGTIFQTEVLCFPNQFVQPKS